MRHIESVVNFIMECFSLKHIQRSSYQTLGVKSGTIAEHTFTTAIIGYCLAKLENVDVNRVVKMCLFHDLVETRTGDANFPQKRYQLQLEEKAMRDTTQHLPKNMKEEIRNLFLEFEDGRTKEARIAREADKLEQLFQEKRHMELGVEEAEKWFAYSMKNLRLRSAERIGRAVFKGRFSQWWMPLIQEPPLKQKKGNIARILNKLLK